LVTQTQHIYWRRNKMIPKTTIYEWQENDFNVRYIENSDGTWAMIKKPLNLEPADYELNGGK